MNLSIIIPFFNAERSILDCLNSIIQTNSISFEIILIDDCSSDNGYQIVNQFIIDKNINNAILIKHNGNRGVASARNTGLEHATGEYIYFIDADDTIEKGALDLMFQKANENNLDIVGCEWNLQFHKNARYMKQPSVQSPQDAFQKFTSGLLRWNLWLFMFRRDLLKNKNIKFLDGQNMGEDMMFVGKLLLNAQKIEIIHIPLYNYVQTNENSLTKDMSANHRIQVTNNVLELESYIKNKDLNLEKEIELLKLNIKLPLLTSNNRSNYKLWNSWFPDANDYIWKNEHLPIRTKILQSLAHKKIFFLINFYNKLVFKLVYGIIYR